MASKDGVVLAGNNEDWKDPFTSVWYVPSSDNEFGRVCFGSGSNTGNPQGGMNDQGLFIDLNALGPNGWQSVESKQKFNGHIIDYILAHCASVEDAIKFFKKYNVRSLRRAKLPIADKTGASIVVEWGQGKLQILRRNGYYQVSTNFVQTNYEPENYPCHRYKTAEQIFQNSNKLTIDVIREILSATHAEGSYPTTYSNIYDLKNGEVYIYNFHNFEDVVKINLKDELTKGQCRQEISSLFPYISNAHKIFMNQSAKATLYNTITSVGVKVAIEKYFEMKKQSRVKSRYNVTEEDINSIGYQLLRSDKIKDALEIFKLNVKEYPKSANVYDSLGEAYMNNGEKELAIQNYKKSLELDPKNNNANNMLKKLKK